MMQPTCVEVEDEYWVQARMNHLIIDPYAWEPSAERSPTEEQDELCEELLGEKEWDERKRSMTLPNLMRPYRVRG